MPCEVGSLTVIVEDKPLIDPVLDKKDHEVECVKHRNTSREGKCHEYSGKYLGVSHMQDELWPSV